MKASIEDIGKEKPAEIPDWNPEQGMPSSPEPKAQRHPALVNEEVLDRQADRQLRVKFGDKAYKVAKKSLYGWCWLLTIYAMFKFRFKTELFSDNVLMAITTAVTLNVFAAFLGVIRGLFPSSKVDKE
ncbi:hypothetical protein [Kosakonia radicincitans]|uniref:hypothetical protein n=1 Tax=Kosakonia radicincitans TaxID=283686 RepID=UPI0005C2F2C2|nr:hypothetical protein [Kosakonia radicincitans]KIS43905.1 hypothetical protein LG58_2607 [Kosakonia radicincitans YD4]